MPVPLPDDPYVAVRQTQLVDTDTESNPEEAPSKAEESQPLGSRVPLVDEEFKAFEPSSTRTDSSHSLASLDSTTPLSPDHPLTHARMMRERSDDEDRGLDDEGRGLEGDGLGLDEEEEALPYIPINICNQSRLQRVQMFSVVLDHGESMGDGTTEDDREIGREPDDHSGDGDV
nr:hypothetical protein [Tanacetum cinerariifolium]